MSLLRHARLARLGRWGAFDQLDPSVRTAVNNCSMGSGTMAFAIRLHADNVPTDEIVEAIAKRAVDDRNVAWGPERDPKSPRKRRRR